MPSLRPFTSAWDVWIITVEFDVMAWLMGVLGVKAGAMGVTAFGPTTGTGTVAGGVCDGMLGRATRGVAVAGVVVVSAGRALALLWTGSGTGTGAVPQLMMLCVTDELGTVWVDSETFIEVTLVAIGVILVATLGFSAAAAELTNACGGRTFSFSFGFS